MNKFYNNVIEIDEIKRKTLISDIDIEKLKDLIGNHQFFQYFFYNEKDEKWLAIFLKNSFFNLALSHTENNIIVSRTIIGYLKDVCQADPSNTTKLITLLYPYANDPYNILIILKIGLLVPSEYTAKLLPVIKISFENKNRSYINNDIGGWLKHLINGKQTKVAFKLLKIIITPDVAPSEYSKKKKRAMPRIEPYWLKGTLDNLISEFIKIDPLKTVNLFSSALRRALVIEYANSSYESSNWWQPKIGSDFKGPNDNIKQILVKNLVKALEAAAKNKPREMKNILSKYLTAKRSIYRRIAFYILRLNYDKYKSIVTPLINDKKLLFKDDIRHEYYLLLQTAFPRLSKTKQNSILDSIVKKSETFNDPKYTLYILFYYFKDHLSGKYKDEFEKLGKDKEPPRDSDFEYEGYAGEISPYTVDELLNMGDELWEKLNSFIGNKGFRQPNFEGLARTFSSVVTSDSNRFITKESLDKIVDLPFATYPYWVVDSLIEYIKRDGAENKIDLILDFCYKIITKKYPTNSDNTYDSEYISLDGLKVNTARLIEELLRNKKKEFSKEYRDKMWNIIKCLCEDTSNPVNLPTELRDPVTELLNTVRGKGFMLLVDYSLRYAVYVKEEHDKNKVSNRFQGEERALELLDYMLDLENEKSYAIHAGYGLYLPNLFYLNSTWTNNNLQKIFPDDKDSEGYWKTAWIGYMYSSHFYDEIYIKLLSNYKRVIEKIEQGESLYKSDSGTKSEEATCEHLILACFRKLDNLNHEESLLKRFLTIPRNPYMAHAVQFVANLAADSKIFTSLEIDTQYIWQQAMKFWKIRIERAKYEREIFKDLEEEYFDNEFSTYINWLDDFPDGRIKEISPFLKETIKLNKRMWHLPNIIKYLEKESAGEPTIAIELLNELLKTEAQVYFYTSENEGILTILNNAYSAGERTLTDEIPNTFGECGIYAFKDFWMTHFAGKE